MTSLVEQDLRERVLHLTGSLERARVITVREHSPGKSVTVGRDPASQVRLDGVAVSRRHAVFNEFGGRWHVSDLHSSRGTYRNGAPIPPGQDVPLEVGDQLLVGDTTLVFTVR